MDVLACKVVLRLTPAVSGVSHVQGAGRARQQGGSMISLVHPAEQRLREKADRQAREMQIHLEHLM
jgi:hypothetical protein